MSTGHNILLQCPFLLLTIGNFSLAKVMCPDNRSWILFRFGISLSRAISKVPQVMTLDLNMTKHLEPHPSRREKKAKNRLKKKRETPFPTF
ncbi:hypothetical protein EDC01DRAFT_676705 [Geopyxis carbonaria]|nr:hypothetical protein EDC01DRAFT_676705 [Geopyxis carbonaria]